MGAHLLFLLSLAIAEPEYPYHGNFIAKGGSVALERGTFVQFQIRVIVNTTHGYLFRG